MLQRVREPVKACRSSGWAGAVWGRRQAVRAPQRPPRLDAAAARAARPFDRHHHDIDSAAEQRLRTGGGGEHNREEDDPDTDDRHAQVL